LTYGILSYTLGPMLVIRLQRVGRRNDPAFRIVVTERRSKPKTGGIEILGSYHPKTKAAVLKKERILYWMSRGAKMSDTVHNLLISKGVIRGNKIDVVKTKPSVAAAALPPAEAKEAEAAKIVEAAAETAAEIAAPAIS